VIVITFLSLQENEEKNKSLLDTVPNEILDTGDPLKLR